jgi:hypothetical protein
MPAHASRRAFRRYSFRVSWDTAKVTTTLSIYTHLFDDHHAETMAVGSDEPPARSAERHTAEMIWANMKTRDLNRVSSGASVSDRRTGKPN